MEKLPWLDEVHRAFWHGHMPIWYSRSITPLGFEEGFSETWTSYLRPLRSAVFQARMTWMAATAARFNPEYLPAAEHGLECLRKFINADGSVTWSIRLDGEPANSERHAYAASFVLFALAAVARGPEPGDALELAHRVASYLETHHRDPEHGGYWEVTDDTGQPVRNGEDVDAIGTVFGRKSQNTHLHLLEAYAELHRAQPSVLTERALKDTLEIFQYKLYVPEGWLHVFAEADWTPVPGAVSYGHDIEAAHLLLDASQTLGPLDPAVAEMAVRITDYTLQFGGDPRGGFFNEGSPDGKVTDPTKIWWVQAEGLLGLAAVYRLTGNRRYLEAAVAQWCWIRDYQIDAQHGGWWESVNGHGTPIQRAKAHAWKAAYHDGRALLFTHQLLSNP